MDSREELLRTLRLRFLLWIPGIPGRSEGVGMNPGRAFTSLVILLFLSSSFPLFALGRSETSQPGSDLSETVEVESLEPESLEPKAPDQAGSSSPDRNPDRNSDWNVDLNFDKPLDQDADSLTGSLGLNAFLFKKGPYYDDASAAYRTGRIDPHVLTVPSLLSEQAFSDPHSHLYKLVDYLMQGARDDYHRVKRLHDWMVEHFYYDFDSYNRQPTWNEADRGKKLLPRRVCAGFASLFEQLCILAGLRCITITGDGKTSAGLGHAWNRVYIGKTPYEVDVTHDCLNRYINGEYHQVEAYQDIHLFQRPETKLLWFYPTVGLHMPSIELSSYDFRVSPAHSIQPFMYGINPEARSPNLPLEKVRRDSPASRWGYLEDAYLQNETPLVLTLERKRPDLEIRASLYDLEGRALKTGAGVRFDGPWIYASFTAPPLADDLYRQEYLGVVSFRDSSTDEPWQRAYDFLLVRQFRHSYLPRGKPLPREVIRPETTEILLTVDTAGRELDQSRFLEWENRGGVSFSHRLSAWNADSFALSTINYRIELPEPGYYRFSILGGPAGEFPAETTVYCGDEMAVLRDYQGASPGEWGPYGRVPVIAREREMIISVGNGLMMKERTFRISFEALKLEKVGDLPRERELSEEGFLVIPSEDYIIPSDTIAPESRTAQWTREEGGVSAILSTAKVDGESTADITFDLLLPAEGVYQFFVLDGRKGNYWPSLRLLTDSGIEYVEGPGHHEGEGSWRKMSNMPFAINSRKVRITLGNDAGPAGSYTAQALKDQRVTLSFEALRVEKVRDLSYQDRENIFLTGYGR